MERLCEEVEAGPGAGSRLVVAVSGGSDSVALLYGLVALREPLGLQLVVAHLDHALRPESAEDAAFVGQLALSLDVQCLRERRDVRALAEAEGRNLEEMARHVRYEMLEAAAQAVEADAIVLAHTADDQAETLLMHLLRGAGLDGLKGMMPRAPSPIPGATTPLFRPLLRVERATLREWLRENGIPWHEDVSNLDISRFRSRLRYHVIRLLEQEQPHLRSHLATTAHLLAADYTWLEEETEAAWQQLAEVDEGSVRMERGTFLALPLALQRRVIRRAFFHLRPTARDLSFEQVEQALDIAARGESGARATLPTHLFLIVEYNNLWIAEEVQHPELPTLEHPLMLPKEGEVQAEELHITVKQVGREAIPGDWTKFPSTTALLDVSDVKWPLRLRPPEPGDRWAPLGMDGQTVDLRDWLAKHKVPPSHRDRIPLLVDAEGEILWVVGWQVGHPARVRPSSERLLQITVNV
ncbi:MAG: tRNA lysidine(34) synthetase TilS [Chloroflexota bacterium]|nr:tRNA lysidine(34) synthetase TilS [Chloroflexota bacterium]